MASFCLAKSENCGRRIGGNLESAATRAICAAHEACSAWWSETALARSPIPTLAISDFGTLSFSIVPSELQVDVAGIRQRDRVVRGARARILNRNASCRRVDGCGHASNDRV